MGIGRILGAAAPIAAGYFAGPAGFAGLGAGTASAVTAGALTGAGIAALSGEDVLGGAFTGGLGGMAGGGIGTAAQATAAPTTTTAATNAKASLGGFGSGTQAASGSFNPALQGTFEATRNLPPLTAGAGQAYAGPASMMSQSNVLSKGAMTGEALAGGGGYNPSAFGRGVEGAQAAFEQPREFLKNLGEGSEAMGAGKLGITGLGVAGQAGAFEPDMPTYGDNMADKYDPRRRLDLSMDTGINTALSRDTGLRLLAEGGEVKKFQMGGMSKNEYTPEQLSSLAEYGVVPQYKAPQMYGMGAFANSDKYKTAQYRNPVTGIVDVGGKFVADPKGDITDVEYTKRFDYILNPTKDKGDQAGDMSSIDKSAKSGVPTGAIAALASGFAEQQESPVKSQTLGLKALEAGGYLETGGEVGDGMSDEIEATIEGTQEARLSDGEFVIPADVVSHLGNGSSDAGARRLYEMMDKVRMARTGNKKQGKEIEPERYMPR